MFTRPSESTGIFLVRASKPFGSAGSAQTDMVTRKVPMNPRFAEERWRTVRSALGNWPRTIRLCLIILVIGAPTHSVLWMILR